MECWGSLLVTVSMTEADYFILLFTFYFWVTVLICDNSLLLFHTSCCQKRFKIKRSSLTNLAFFFSWETRVLLWSGLKKFFLVEVQFTLVHKLQNFLLSGFTGAVFWPQDKGRWHRKRPKCSHGVPKAEYSLKWEKVMN